MSEFAMPKWVNDLCGPKPGPYDALAPMGQYWGRQGKRLAHDVAELPVVSGVVEDYRHQQQHHDQVYAAAVAKREQFNACTSDAHATAEAYCSQKELPNGDLAQSQAECMAFWANGMNDTVRTDGSSGQTTWGGGQEHGTEASNEAGVSIEVLSGKSGNKTSEKETSSATLQVGHNQSAAQTVKGFPGYRKGCADSVGLGRIGDSPVSTTGVTR